MSATVVRDGVLPRGQLIIDGERIESSDGATLEVIAPASGETIARIARATEEDLNRAVDSARAAFRSGPWAEMSGARRGEILWRLAELIEANRAELAELESLDVGRPVGEPFHAEIPAVIDVFRHFAGWADKLTGSTFDLPPFAGAPRFSYTLRQPLGVIGAITPWNAPTMIASWKIAPALAAGNTVVLKPAQEAPLTALRLGELALEAGLPAGVLNVVPGPGRVIGTALAAHPGIDKVSFTGSTDVGRDVALAAAPNFTKVTLELGGKSPQIVWPDADLDAVLPVAALSVFANQGQTCASGSRIYVHRDVIDEFVERLARRAGEIRLGDPLDESTEMGSLINARQRDRVLGYIDSARREGARIVAGGDAFGERGFMVQPTVIVGEQGNTVAREEIFGPVATVIPFDDDDEALELANDSSYGLTAVLWTDSSSRINRFTRELEAGVVWVNAWGPPHPALPWLGAKQSGIGEELGLQGLHSATKVKTVNVLSQ